MTTRGKPPSPRCYHTASLCGSTIVIFGGRNKRGMCQPAAFLLDVSTKMWSEVPAVKVVAWRMLDRLRTEGWPQDLLDMMYLDEETLHWAEAEARAAENAVVHLDSNGVQLQNGDTVVLIQDLNVKGGGFTAKRGTAVRNIRLVHDNPEHIEGKVNGQQIVILTKYVKK